MSSLGSQLAGARSRLGITQAQVAELLGTSQANVSAYERGRLVPGRLVANRIEEFGALGHDSVFRGYRASTMASAAAQLRLDLRADRSETDMLRVVIQASDDFSLLKSEADRTFFLSEPSPSGSREWDSLLAGLAVHLCRQAVMKRTPRWADGPTRAVDFMWWCGSAGSVQSLRAVALRDAIPSMRARGVILSRRVLESI